MKNSFGEKIKITFSGESHSPEMSVIIENAEHLEINEGFMKFCLSKRKPAGAFATQRKEDDEPKISKDGNKIIITFENRNCKPEDYKTNIPRPSHADFPAWKRYGSIPSGGGAYSGRMTVLTVAAGSIFLWELKKRNIRIATHIAEIHGVKDRNITENDIETMGNKIFPVLDSTAEMLMKEEINSALNGNDSLGGITETIISGLPAGLGEPIFDSVESLISHIVFSIPSVKGIEFGKGFGFSDMYGSEANDRYVIRGGEVQTETNNQGGICGGMANGMPVIFRTVFKPVPTIKKEQKTVDLNNLSEVICSFGGRHDGCILPRVPVILDCAAAIAVYELLSEM